MEFVTYTNSLRCTHDGRPNDPPQLIRIEINREPSSGYYYLTPCIGEAHRPTNQSTCISPEKYDNAPHRRDNMAWSAYFLGLAGYSVCGYEVIKKENES